MRDRAVAVRGLDNESGKVQNRPPVGVGVADVDRGLNIRPEEVLKPVDGIRNGAKTPGSCAITGDGQVLASQCLPDEGGDDAPVVGPHPGAVRIEDARDADVEVVFVAIGADERLAIPFRFVVTRPGTVGVDVTAVVFRLGIEFGVAVHLAGRCEEVLGVFLLSDAEGLVGAQRADLERLDGLVPVEDRGGETREVDHPVKIAGHVDELRDVVFAEREAVVVEHVVRLSVRPVTRFSIATTSWPSAMRASHRCEPMKPAPPVTRTLLIGLVPEQRFDGLVHVPVVVGERHLNVGLEPVGDVPDVEPVAL